MKIFLSILAAILAVTIFILLGSFIMLIVLGVLLPLVFVSAIVLNTARLSLDATVTKKLVIEKNNRYRYYINFTVGFGKGMELKVPKEDFDHMTEGDKGLLTTKGRRYEEFKIAR